MRESDLVIPQQEINAIFSQPKVLNLTMSKWTAKQQEQPAPQWLEVRQVFLDADEIPFNI